MSRYMLGNLGSSVPKNIFFASVKSKRLPQKRGRKSWMEIFDSAAICRGELEGDDYKRQESHDCQSPEILWEFIFSRLKCRESNWLFVHNASELFQLTSFFDLLSERKLIIHEKPGDFRIGVPIAEKKKPWRGMVVVENKPVIVKCRHAKGTLVIVDVLNYLPKSLSDIAQELGMERLAAGPDIADCQRNKAVNANSIDIMRSLILPMISSWGKSQLGNFAHTAAGLAMNCYRHKFAPKISTSRGKQKVNIVLHGNPEATRLERSAYHGGAVRNFFLGCVSPVKNQFSTRAHSDDILRHLDCRSLFPFSMANSLLPWKLKETHDEVSQDKLCELAKQFGVIAEVGISTEKIPFAIKHNGSLKYVIGNFTCSLCGDELSRAIAEKVIRKVYRVNSYLVAPIFRDYVAYWDNRRTEAKGRGDRVDDIFSKTMLNTLYGKFGQRSPAWIDRPEMILDSDYGYHYLLGTDSNKMTKYRSLGGEVQEATEQTEGKNAFPAIAAFVTANAREYMRRITEIMPPRSLYYTHTDSFICNNEGYLSLLNAGLIGEGMGKFREIDEPTTSAEFFGPGDYEYGRKVVMTGRKENAVIVSDGEYEQEESYGIQSVIARGPNGGVTVRKVRKKRTGTNSTITATHQGWAVPLRLDLPFPRKPLPQPELLG